MKTNEYESCYSNYFQFSVLVSFSQWIHLEAKDHDLEFVQTVLYFSTQILQRSDAKRVHRAGSICSNISSSLNPSGRNFNGCRAESSLFSIQPKRLSEVRINLFELPFCRNI